MQMQMRSFRRLCLKPTYFFALGSKRLILEPVAPIGHASSPLINIFLRPDSTLFGAGKFPVKSLAIFLIAALVLRMFGVLASAFFPGFGLFPQFARVTILLLAAIGLWALSQRVLLRDGFPPDALGLDLHRIGWFFTGGFVITPVILLMAGAVWLMAPFHWERGSLTWPKLFWQTAEYFGGNFGEELIFRGYLLLLLTRYLRLTGALFTSALLFGIFHLPGLSGWTAAKMVSTTAAMSFLFAYGYIFTGSLWTAVGLHVFGNVSLHCVIGMSDGASILSPVIYGTWPKRYDPAFCALMAVTIPIALTGHLRILRAPATDIAERHTIELSQNTRKGI